MADPYDILGVAKTASHDEIRKAYRALAKKNHPDLNPGNKEAEQRFKEISSAYDIVGDEAKRKRFDAGEIDETGAERPERHFYREYAEADPNNRYTRHAHSESFSDIDPEIFADLFGGRAGGRGQRMRMDGGSVRYTMTVDFLEAVNGARKTVTMPDGKTLDIKIPAGLREGQILRLKGQGMPGIGGGEPGDALVEIHIAPHPEFTREGSTIRSVLPITFSEALNGGTARARTVDGSVNVKIPKGANSGTILRLRGKGVPASGSRAAGDHLIELRIAAPPKPDDDLARTIAEWEAKHPYDPRTTSGDTP
jgi:DnaJ-class molecular chaperone